MSDTNSPVEQAQQVAMDGGTAVAHIAYRVSEVISIYPITPSTDMAELSDNWSSQKKPNIWGQVPDVIEMQSEGGAAGTAHGALQTGALTTTFTASQGLMLMLPNMYKIAGELTACVFHVAARSLAAQGLSIFGDHQDVMAARTTGFAMLASSSVQEAHDAALITHAATLEARIPFINFFDGFRTSHEINKIRLIPDAHIRAMIDDELVFAHRNRALNPSNPFIRGTAQNPDVYFQGRESVNSFYAATPEIVQGCMDRFAKLTGRQYHLFDYHGAPDAEHVIIIMGSGAETVCETIDVLNANGAKFGVLIVRLYRPFSAKHLIGALPASCKRIAVLDRTKEPGSGGEPLYLDVVTALVECVADGSFPQMPAIIGGRYGLSSKEFTPAMVKAIYAELAKDKSKNHFTIGINDDVTHSSLEYDPSFSIEPKSVTRALFFGLGSDGTVSANKNSIKIIGESTDLYCQGYFVYDSKKAGSHTISHLRFGPEPIHAPYLIESANFIACHKATFIDEVDMLDKAADGAVFLLNTPHSADEIWATLPLPVQQQMIEHHVHFYVIDASSVARDTGMRGRINTIMQTCFFALSGVLPREEAIAKIKTAIEKTYSKKGAEIVKQNFVAVDAALDHLHEVKIPQTADSLRGMHLPVPAAAPKFVQEVTGPMLAGHGDALPVSMLPVDGTYPSSTAKWEKRNISDFVPKWEPDTCIQCGNCSYVCPHSVIRAKFYHEDHLEKADEGFHSAPVSARGFPETRYTLQIYVEDCTGCELCVHACPALDPADPTRKAINMDDKAPLLEQEKKNIEFFETIPYNERANIDFSSVRGAQFLEPLFEFSGACSGCGETPYIRLLTQLFGPRLLVANATGCSSIFGGNLPATPWSKNADGKGPAWSNSLFEDNAEFGLGMRISADHQLAMAKQRLHEMGADYLDLEFIEALCNTDQHIGSEMHKQALRVKALKSKLAELDTPASRELLTVADHLLRRSVWLVGGDGWAYDIGSSGLDHALATGRNINVLVLDTEVYSNTGGQASKSTPTAATAKFAAAGKRVGKKDLALQAISYGNVYVARVAMGANPQQTLLAMREAEEYDGPSLILAYSHCIAHGIDMTQGLTQQDLAVASGYWPLIRYNPALRRAGKKPFVLDSPAPRIKLKEYAYNEMRYKSILRTNPEEAERLMTQAQATLERRWNTYEHMATQESSDFQPTG
ncbi:MAG: pyruvate:ferredoxin (flavodoxin) oxidoreductase [Zetaproteobacteria bacterium CG12_big_fil_rev_8_21_14_0_65_55_1124]|nr:MAG: pyruvate:ferredoxin (flavodoxin) oxidoreductase [Zetaproteobacteria bacterium CG1_02_55_237]PIS20361.1 MAG: pyruvate:ferredoxin (flavodoxin) oxidoreductase [Zetaproteobacteria bacterium CG08_land_8_20_14_0_20_55_17]PIW42414.1 MAG: pyruvate:ferredoxin (flavodoxin) oxidoreductase [Zetaproteobacteria bacterium CG12_big_fil_rev_8_21_14_0_65_55_1124]PIY52363.1 MAG: pyruvate:ferredoxin (flavodoxin) oxidoreductase [Zetaproteobacteria bacterium CG_4_10_14_0_8_um_filter_55_43]PIZ37142.1 MAG: pyr